MNIQEYYEIHVDFYDHEKTYAIIKKFDNIEEMNIYKKYLDKILFIQRSKEDYSNSYWTNFLHEEFGWGILYPYICYKIIKEKL